MDKCKVKYCRNKATMTWLEHRICFDCYDRYCREELNLKEAIGEQDGK